MQVLSYNILLGGTSRTEPLTSMIRGSQANVIGLVEANDASVVEELATRLNMHFFLTGHGQHRRDWNIAFLSHLPIISTQIHTNLAIFSRRHMLEVTLEEPDGQPCTIFMTHLTASFYRGPESNRMRRAEVQEIMRIMETKKGTPHLLMGDFNSIAPGDTLDTSNILRIKLQQRDQSLLYRKKMAIANQKPYRPPRLRERIFTKVVRILLRSRGGRVLLEATAPLYTRGGIDLLLQDGYTDCFRHLHPQEAGFTYPSDDPSCRIDYIFASPEMAARLQSCTIVTEGDGVGGEAASDHLPVCAVFRDA
ncbi:MAG TPA: endonuclease/exonuclease/phosphatase family protein [Ktedonobacteraceae bacterium]|nr:endonuclease/exonuclease/phosphatase family protein [Ktedonobacteraceae bacterium]